jgi:hypothetical protein
MSETMFTFTGYDDQLGFCYNESNEHREQYRMIFGAMIYFAEDKQQLKDLLAWCIDPVTFGRGNW